MLTIKILRYTLTDLLFRPKIIWGEISDKTKFCIDAEGVYSPEATTFMLSGEDLYLILAFLNCPVSEYAFSKIGTTTGVGTVRWKKFKIEQLYVPTNVPKSMRDEIVRVCQKITKGTNGEQTLNRMIYSVFALNDDEVRFIETYRDSI